MSGMHAEEKGREADRMDWCLVKAMLCRRLERLDKLSQPRYVFTHRHDRPTFVRQLPCQSLTRAVNWQPTRFSCLRADS